MKAKSAIAAILILVAGAGAYGQDHGLGLGIIAGAPTGVAAKLWLGDATAVDAAAAWSFVDPAAFHFHADYLVHVSLPSDLKRGSLMLHFGAGARVKLEDDARVGVRVPVGIAYWLEDLPLDLFLEVAGVVDLVPATDFELNAGVGVRFFFGKGR